MNIIKKILKKIGKEGENIKGIYEE